MVDNKIVLPRSTLELLDNVPESLLRRLKQYSGRFSTQAVSAMQDRLPFFAELEASQRASLALVVQTAVANFVEWMTDPRSNINYTARAFELMPQDLTRRIALRQSARAEKLPWPTRIGGDQRITRRPTSGFFAEKPRRSVPLHKILQVRHRYRLPLDTKKRGKG